jgi:outer membrane protein assembly factor BamB
MLEKLKAYGPAIALGVILIVFVVVKFVILPARQAAPPQEAPTPAEAPAHPSPTPTTPPAPTANPQEAAPAVTEVPSATAWSTFHGEANLVGHVATPVPDAPAPLWQFLASGRAQTPVGDAQSMYIATANGKVHALAYDGQERWSRQLARAEAGGAERPERIEAPPAVFAGTLYVGSTTGNFYAMDAATGDIRWTYDVGGSILGSASFDAASGKVLVLQREDGIMHCLDATTGKNVWKTDPIARCDGSPSVQGGVVVWGACDSILHLHAVADGQRRALVELGGDCQVASGPAIVGDDIFVGSRCGRFLRIDARSGKVLWTNSDSKKEIFTTPTLAGGMVFFATDGDELYALDTATGAAKWRREFSGLPTSPVAVGERLLVSVAGALHLLNRDTGETLWTFEVSDDISSPALIGGMIVVASDDGNIHAFGAKP